MEIAQVPDKHPRYFTVFFLGPPWCGDAFMAASRSPEVGVVWSSVLESGCFKRPGSRHYSRPPPPDLPWCEDPSKGASTRKEATHPLPTTHTHSPPSTPPLTALVLIFLFFLFFYIYLFHF